MKGFIKKLIQVPFDVVAGLAIYYCANLADASTTSSVLLSVVATAVFAELLDVRLRK